MDESSEADMEPAPTQEKAKAISGLSADTAHKICSDRVIGSIGVAIKELVENSLDAGATSITVRMKGYGLDMIEVSDNGQGVKSSDYDTLAKSFHTSKLNEFSDLDAIGTFGFRGEALSSLCRVCDGIEVVTKHESSSNAVRLKYDASGDLVEQSTAPGQMLGTKVTVKKLFGTLPVRRKIFQDKSQIEFSKALNLLHAYCIISDGVKFQIFHEVADGKESKKLAYTSGGSIKNNMTQILSQKLVQNLLPFKSESHPSFHIEGFISSCGHDAGRRVPDKQFFYLNKRPVDMPQVARSINQLYKQFNKNQFPLIVLHVKTTTTNSVDVNLAPDKRSVVIKNQNSLISLVQDVLSSAFEDIPKTINLSNSISTKCKESNSFFEKFSLSGLLRQPKDEAPVAKKARFTVYESPKLKLDNFFVRLPKNQAPSTEEISKNASVSSVDVNHIAVNIPSDPKNTELELSECDHLAAGTSAMSTQETLMDESHQESSSHIQSPITRQTEESIIEATGTATTDEEGGTKMTESKDDIPAATSCKDKIQETVVSKVKISQAVSVIVAAGSSRSRGSQDVVKFTAGLDPLKGELAEEELKRVFQKDDFLKMKVIGQFNHGFVIARLNEDVFIIDQHASDEKYNFEKLCKTTKTKGQRLVLPMKLKLSAAQELVFTHHANVFRENGYEFNLNDNETLGKRIELTAVPSLLHATFGLDDILDVIYQLQDSPYAEIKSKRVRTMLASKACRYSIMIGEVMDQFGMRRLLDNMATIDQPWNCPHGRPTMRHLFNHVLLQKQHAIKKLAPSKPNLAKIKL